MYFCVSICSIAYVMTVGDFNMGTLKKFTQESNIVHETIRLVKISKDFHWSSKVRPACLPRHDQHTERGAQCMITDVTGQYPPPPPPTNKYINKHKKGKL